MTTPTSSLVNEVSIYEKRANESEPELKLCDLSLTLSIFKWGKKELLECLCHEFDFQNSTVESWDDRRSQLGASVEADSVKECETPHH